MNNNERLVQKDDEFWIEELRKAGILESLGSFDTVYTFREKPDTSNNPKSVDLFLDGRYCDVYLIGPDRDSTNGLSNIFIHIKKGPEKQQEETFFNQFSTDNSQSDRAQTDAEKHEEQE